MAIRELTVQDRVFPSSPRSHKMSLGSTFGAMFIALLIDAMWILLFDRFMYFSILANLQSVWHRHSVSFLFRWNSKLSSPRQLLVLQYYFMSIHESDNWLIKTMVNDPVLNSIGIINTDMLGRSPQVCILFFSSFCPQVWDQTSNYKDLLWLSTPPVSAILCINHSSPTLGTTQLWMSYQCTPSLLSVYTSWNIDIILLQHWLCTLWLLTGMFKYLRMFLFTDSVRGHPFRPLPVKFCCHAPLSNVGPAPHVTLRPQTILRVPWTSPHYVALTYILCSYVPRSHLCLTADMVA